MNTAMIMIAKTVVVLLTALLIAVCINEKNIGQIIRTSWESSGKHPETSATPPNMSGTPPNTSRTPWEYPEMLQESCENIKNAFEKRTGWGQIFTKSFFSRN